MGDTTANENSDSSEEQKNDIISNSSEGDNQKKQRTRKIIKKELPIEENLTQELSNDTKEEKNDVYGLGAPSNAGYYLVDFHV